MVLTVVEAVQACYMYIHVHVQCSSHQQGIYKSCLVLTVVEAVASLLPELLKVMAARGDS